MPVGLGFVEDVMLRAITSSDVAFDALWCACRGCEACGELEG